MIKPLHKNIFSKLALSGIVLLDLFSGTGGFAKGLTNAGFKIEEHYFSEIDKSAIANYKYNFRDAKNIGDITKVKTDNFTKPNIVTFGSPCQDISIAGKRKGLKGKRSGLFFEAARIIKECKPDLFIFENVKGLFSSNKGKDFEVVLKTFADLGLYNIQWQLLNTRWFLPQNRERIYIIGSLGNKPAPKVFPIPQSSEGDHALDQNKAQRQTVSPTIDTRVGDGAHRSPYVLQWKGSHSKWAYEKMPVSPALHTQTDWIRNPILAQKSKIKLFHVPEATRKGYASASVGDSINLSFLSANKRRGRVGKGIASTLDTGMNQYTLMQGNLRKLTPTECERLQGFPDGWTLYGLFEGVKKEISDAQRYKMLGNAVSVAVVEQIAKQLLGTAIPQTKTTEKNIKMLILELELENLDFNEAA